MRPGLILITGVMAISGVYITAKNNSNGIEISMKDENKIAREWIEIREENKDNTLVFRPADFPVPPARGRRHLKLTQAGIGNSLGAGPTDKPEAQSKGDWGMNENKLSLNIPGWEGEYTIETLQDDMMVLKKAYE